MIELKLEDLVFLDLSFNLLQLKTNHVVHQYRCSKIFFIIKKKLIDYENDLLD